MSGESNIFRKVMSIQEIGVILPLVFLIALTGIIRPVFFTQNNVVSVLRWLAFYAIIAIGETLVLMVAEVDISVGQMAGLGAIVSAWLMTAGNLNPILSVIITLIICALLGVMNGVLVSHFKISAFITTIGMMYICKGLKYIISRGYPIYPLPASVNSFGVAKPFGLSWTFVIAIILVFIFDIVLRRSVYGRKLHAVGDNIEVSALAGINVNWIKISAFMISAALAGVSGCLLAAQIQTAQPSMGDGWELQAVAAVAVGGISLKGGSGTILGAFLGVTFIQVMNNSFVLLSIDANLQTMLVGIVLLIAVASDVIKRNRKIKG